jgi:tetratricopeptide (TPR) repeat protein
MEAETAGDLERAASQFEKAWSEASTDWEKCVSAHYLARQQKSPQATLHWNEECLRYADAVGDESVAGFYPSLYLNIAHSYEILGNRDLAIEGYQNAGRLLRTLPPGPYADMVQDGVSRGLARMGCITQQEG